MNWTAFEQFVSVFMEKEHVPGVAVAVAKNGEVIYEKGFGYRNLKTHEVVTPETIFGTASVTKSFTAAAIVDLESQGKLSIKDPISKYLPELKLPHSMNTEDIQIHHLLSHTTGLPPIARREDLNRLEDHLNYLGSLDLEPLGKPGEFISYSNDAFLLLGLIIERVTGKLFRRYITETFLDKLDMTRSTFSLEELAKFDNVTEPYIYDQSADYYKLAVWSKLGNYEVGGGIRSNVIDLLKYGQIYLGDSQEKYSKMWQPTYHISQNRHYGYGFEIVPNYEGVTLVKHSGGQPGVSSHFGFIPEQGYAIAVLTNLSDVPASEVWLAAANTILDVPVDQKIDIGSISEMNPTVAGQYVGTYTSGEGDKLTIQQESNHLNIIFGQEKYELKQIDDHTLVIEDEHFPIRLYFDDNQEPWALLFGLRVLKKQTEMAPSNTIQL